MLLNKQKKPKKLPRVALLALPLIILAAGNFAYAGVNQAVYGVRLVNDRTSGPCARLMRDLYAIDDGTNDKKEWVSDRDLILAKSASPTLNAVADWDAWQRWKDNEHGAMTGDHAEWALRDVAADNSYYRSAKTAAAFYTRVADELETAFDRGTLPEQSGAFSLTTQFRPIATSDITRSLRRVFVIMRRMGLATDCQAQRLTVATDLGSDTLREWEVDLNQLFPDPDKVAAGDVAETALAARYENNHRISAAILRIWQAVSPVIFYGALVCFVGLWVVLIKSMTKKAPRPNLAASPIIATGLLLTALLNLWIVALFTSWIREGPVSTWQYYYGSAGHILLAVFEVVVWAGALKAARRLWQNHKA